MDSLDCVDLEAIRKTFSYDEANGGLVLIGKRKNGKTFSSERKPNRAGYITVWVNGKDHLEHRLVWFYIHGEKPCGMVDHINRVKTDNRIENLRIVEHSTNAHNRTAPNKGNKSGYLGVTLRGSKYEAAIWVKGKNVRLGIFPDAESAHAEYARYKSGLQLFAGEVGK